MFASPVVALVASSVLPRSVQAANAARTSPRGDSRESMPEGNKSAGPGASVDAAGPGLRFMARASGTPAGAHAPSHTDIVPSKALVVQAVAEEQPQ